jgi:large subunit ribosomal protein L25
MYVVRAEERDPAAKGSQLRRSGRVPCAVYGGPLPAPLSLQMESGAAAGLRRRCRPGTPVMLEVGGRRIPAQVREIGRAAPSGEIEHVDFLALDPAVRVAGRAGVTLRNREMVGGVLSQTLYEIEYTALPEDLFDTVEIDLEGLPLGAAVTAGDLPAFRAGSVELRTPAESTVVRISDRRRTFVRAEA